ncbi:MAG: hypothetical protein J6032_04855 [Bacteroidales bacterium]|nr:hypothetical protein [Bacteroidales bacterium]
MQRFHKQTAKVLLMLLAMLLMLGTKVLHTHHYEWNPSLECQDCLHHTDHSGHISLATDTQSDCLLCQILSVPFVAETPVPLLLLPVPCATLFVSRVQTGFSRQGQHISLRAPPCFSIY